MAYQGTCAVLDLKDLISMDHTAAPKQHETLIEAIFNPVKTTEKRRESPFTVLVTPEASVKDRERDKDTEEKDRVLRLNLNVNLDLNFGRGMEDLGGFE